MDYNIREIWLFLEVEISLKPNSDNGAEAIMFHKCMDNHYKLK